MSRASSNQPDAHNGVTTGRSDVRLQYGVSQLTVQVHVTMRRCLFAGVSRWQRLRLFAGVAHNHIVQRIAPAVVAVGLDPSSMIATGIQSLSSGASLPRLFD